MEISSILSANKYGISDKKNQGFTMWNTPVLLVAYELGLEGINLHDCKVVEVERYGKAPEGFISFNYAENTKEMGLSCSNIKNEDENSPCAWFANREKYTYKGLLLPVSGSDGELLILCLDAEDYDF